MATPPTARIFDEADSRLLGTGGAEAFEAQVNHADGSRRDLLISKATFSVSDTVPKGIVGVMIDITERKRAEWVLFRHANFDSLTDLPNRKLGLERLAQAMTETIQNGGHLLIIIADLDHFKNINESLGHALGDQLVLEAAQRLVACVPEADTVARMVGDEFLIVVSSPELVRNADDLASRILEAFRQPMALPTQEVYVNISLGITKFPSDGNDIHDILGKADTALSQAKAAGRGCYRLYTSDMDRKAVERLALEHRLRHALANGELHVCYQPIFDPHARRIVGAEALARWHSPDFGNVPPDRFIPLAEDVGLVVAIDSWVLATACREAAGWQKLCPWPLSVSVNLSPRHFHSRALSDTVAIALSDAALPPNCLTLEITERLLVGEGTQTVEVLGRLAAMGVEIAVDDFGIGYSALSYLKRFPLSKLKIDKSFVQDITTDATNAALGKAIINLAHSLNLQVVGEGVETWTHLDFLTINGCDLIQGYYYSRPLGPDDFISFLTSPAATRGLRRSP